VGSYPDYDSSRRCLYLPVDHFVVSQSALYDIAVEFASPKKSPTPNQSQFSSRRLRIFDSVGGIFCLKF
jgi:hypothetical protein